MDFNIGDVVIIHKPENVNQSPTWVEGMDQYDGSHGEISYISRSSDGSFYFVEIKGFGTWIFNTDWIELIPDEDEDIQLEDIFSLM